ncbi:MAG: SPFH domain-containing protein, partial [Spirochaetales bacterium]
MGLWDFVKGQLRSVIEWTTANDNKDALFEKWSDRGDEIKNASKLIVNPGQGCIFVYEGKVEAVLTEAGIVELKTSNVPFWTTIKNFMQAFQSHHKVGIYFFRKTNILDQKWGTPSAIKYEDPKYKFPVGLRAFGNYTFKVMDAGSFFVNFVGGHNDFTITQFKQMMNARIMQPLTDYMAECKYSYAEIDAQRMELSEGIYQRLQPEFQKLGFEISDFRIEGTSFDEKTQERIDRISDATADAQAAAAVGLNYAQMQQLGAMRDAAKNEGGAAGMG